MPTQKKRKVAFGPPPQRPHSCSSAIGKANLRQRLVWSALPPNALREIYRCSSFEDRISMGRVCKSWRQGYRDPALWRSRLIEFGGCTSFEKLEYEIFVRSERGRTFTPGQNAKSFADQFSTCLENLEILFKDMSPGSAKGILMDFLDFYSSLEESRLKSLALYNLNLKRLTGPMRTSFLNSFMKLTSGQKFLKKFRMDFPNTDLEGGIQILTCLADACGDTLETLYLKRSFKKEVSIYQQQEIVPQFEKQIQKFTRLRYIHLEYTIVSEDLIKNWALGCPNLSYIKLWVNRNILPSNVVGCQAWQTLVDTHPSLLVEINARLFGSTRQMLPILATAMPVYKLKWEAWGEGTQELDLKCLLHRVASYHRTIKVLFIDIGGEFPNLDNISVQNILANCRNLLPYRCAQDVDLSINTWTLAKIDWFNKSHI